VRAGDQGLWFAAGKMQRGLDAGREDDPAGEGTLDRHVDIALRGGDLALGPEEIAQGGADVHGPIAGRARSHAEDARGQEMRRSRRPAVTVAAAGRLDVVDARLAAIDQLPGGGGSAAEHLAVVRAHLIKRLAHQAGPEPGIEQVILHEAGHRPTHRRVGGESRMEGAQGLRRQGARQKRYRMGVPAPRGGRRQVVAGFAPGGLAERRLGFRQSFGPQRLTVGGRRVVSEVPPEPGRIVKGRGELEAQRRAATPPVLRLRLVVGDEGAPGDRFREVHPGEKVDHAAGHGRQLVGQRRIAGMQHVFPQARDEIRAVVVEHPFVQAAGLRQVAEIADARVEMAAGMQGHRREAAVRVPAFGEHPQAASGEIGIGEQMMGAQELHPVIPDPEHAVALDAVLVEGLHAEADRPLADGPGVVQQGIRAAKAATVGDRRMLEDRARAPQRDAAGPVDDHLDEAKGAAPRVARRLRPGVELQEIARLMIPMVGWKRILRQHRLLEVLAFDQFDLGGGVDHDRQLQDADQFLAEIEHQAAPRLEVGFAAAEAGRGIGDLAGMGDRGGRARRVDEGEGSDGVGHDISAAQRGRVGSAGQ